MHRVAEFEYETVVTTDRALTEEELNERGRAGWELAGIVTSDAPFEMPYMIEGILGALSSRSKRFHYHFMRKFYRG